MRLFLLSAALIFIDSFSIGAESILPIENTFKVHAVGDSHARFSFAGSPECIPHVIGATTMHRVGRDGLSHVNCQKLGVQENDTVIFVFGEIDVRCHIGIQRDRDKRNEDEIIKSLAQKYVETIIANRKLFQKIHCVIFAVVPPSKTRYNDPLFPFYGSLNDRISLTKKLNACLQQEALKHSLPILDVSADYATAAGSFRPELSDGRVHIGPQSTGPVQQKLAMLLKTLYSEEHFPS